MNDPLKVERIRKPTDVRLTIVYDNNPYQKGLRTDWGFSCHVQLPDTAILFDTGAQGALLMENLRQLGLEPGEIDLVFLSHQHTDHTGGLPTLIEINPDLNVCLPKTFPVPFKKSLSEQGIGLMEIDGFTQIRPGVYATGDLGGWLAEQALIVHTEAGLVVITGCAHPGIVDTLKSTREFFGEKILLAMGGFHLEEESRSELETFLSLFKILGVQQVAPCHCSGEAARKLFQKAYRDGYIEAGVGRRIHFDPDGWKE